VASVAARAQGARVRRVRAPLREGLLVALLALREGDYRDCVARVWQRTQSCTAWAPSSGKRVR
jgi:hypothetical protein